MLAKMKWSILSQFCCSVNEGTIDFWLAMCLECWTKSLLSLSITSGMQQKLGKCIWWFAWNFGWLIIYKSIPSVDEVSGESCQPSLLCMMKVMVWRIVSENHNVMTALILSCNLWSGLEFHYQSHSMMLASVLEAYDWLYWQKVVHQT
jgi:hypothetical protein